MTLRGKFLHKRIFFDIFCLSLIVAQQSFSNLFMLQPPSMRLNSNRRIEAFLMALPSEDATDQSLNPRCGFVPPAYQATAMEKATDDLRVENGLKRLMDRKT